MQTLKSYNPATKEVIGELSKTSAAEITKKVAMAHEAFPAWRALGIEGRSKIILKAYEKISSEKVQEELANLIHTEMGKTLSEARAECAYYPSSIHSLIEEMTQALKPEVIEDAKTKTTLFYDPLGVAGCISPWNFPFGMPHTLLIPTLLAGNTACFKPSEETVLVGQYYANILQEFLPKNVLHLIIGDGEQGKYLVESDIQLITFTGSQATGKRILETGAKDLKRVLLELGGKDPLILMEDADLTSAASFAVNNGCRNAGQVCVSTEQIFVLKKDQEKFEEEVLKAAKTMQVGPMIHFKQKAHVIKQVEEAIKKGAKLIFGEVNRDESNFLNPMVLTNCSMDMNILQDETFGPVLCIVPVETVDQAIEFANRGQFGLGGSVFGTNQDKAFDVARKLHTAMVGINRGPGGAKGSPWVGSKQSGYGHHGHISGHRQFCQLRIVSSFK